MFDSTIALALVLLVIGPPLVVLVVSMAALVSSVREALRAAAWLRIARAERPALPLGRLGRGPVCLEGRAEAVEVARSPVEGAPCVAFALEVRGGLLGRTRARDEQAVAFHLVEGASWANVEGADATAFFSVRGAPRHRPWPHGPFGGWLARATEWRLEPGAPCTVVGAVVGHEPEGETSGYRNAEECPVVGRRREGLLVADGERRDLVRALRGELSLAVTTILVAAATLGSFGALAAGLAGPFHLGPEGAVALAGTCLTGLVALATLGTARRWRRRTPVPDLRG